MPAQIIPVIMCGGNTAVAGLVREHTETVRSPVGRGSTFQQVLARISDSDLFARPIVITIVRLNQKVTTRAIFGRRARRRAGPAFHSPPGIAAN
jgi:hypothetical protein